MGDGRGTVTDRFAGEGLYPSLDGDAAVGRLSRLLTFPTVTKGPGETGGWEAFDAQLAFLQEAYPRVFAAAAMELVEADNGSGAHALLLEIPGTDPDLDPIGLLAHQDVVPVVPGTEGDWTHPPYSGHVDGTWVWGRGAIDMKVQLAGIFEALELVLASGAVLERGVVVACGHDEERDQSGARSVAALLASRGRRLAFLVDEGDYLVHDLAPWGGRGRYLSVAVAEKGYVDLELSAASHGGHSSNPAEGTSLGRLCQAVSRVLAAGSGPRLTPAVGAQLEALAPSIVSGPLAALLEGDPGRVAMEAGPVAEVLAADPATFPLVDTTVAPTMVTGGASAPNVLPQAMAMTVNFRLLPGDTVGSVRSKVADLVADLGVSVRVLPGANEPSRLSRWDGWGMACLKEAVAPFFREDGAPVPLVPTLATGAGDARMYEGVCDQCLRFSAFVGDEDEVERGVHGTNERVLARSFLQGVRVLARLVEVACTEEGPEG